MQQLPALVREIDQALEDLDSDPRSRRRAEAFFASNAHELIAPLLAQHARPLLDVVRTAHDTWSLRQRFTDYAFRIGFLGLALAALHYREALALIAVAICTAGLLKLVLIFRRATPNASRKGRVREALMISIRAGGLGDGRDYSDVEHAGLFTLLQETARMDAPHYDHQVAIPILREIERTRRVDSYRLVHDLALNDTLLRVHPLVSRVAREVLGVLEVVRAQQKVGENLLRPSLSGNAETLVKPASYSESASESLLHSVESSEDRSEK